MKLITRFCYSLTFLLIVLFFTNCERTIFADASPAIDRPSTLEFIRETPGIKNDLSTLSSLLTEFGLDGQLSGNGPYTLFAPTNEAFDYLVADNPDWNSLAAIPQATLKEILDYHFVSDKNIILRDTFVGFVNTSKSTTFDAFASLLVKAEGGIRINGERNIALQDVRTTNGIIQIVDEVMLPPTAFELIKADPRLTTLTELLERENFSTNFMEVLNGEGPFTIFAPTDTAFMNYLLEQSLPSIAAIATADLEKILLNHLSVTDNLRTEDLDNIGGTVETLNNTQLKIVAIAGNNKLGIAGSNEPAAYIDVNGQSTNGVVHLVNNLLLP
ncbi:MAG: fasciclin domain-containing protein [Saprospiraceae bacterium]